jgi:hypothetical protein
MSGVKKIISQREAKALKKRVTISSDCTNIEFFALPLGKML